MDELRYCPQLQSVVTITSNKISTKSMGKYEKRLTVCPAYCSAEEKCTHRYDCSYSSEGKNYDPDLIMVHI